MVDRHWVRAWSIAAGACLAVLGTFLPWLRSGTADRSSYEIFDLVDRLGFSPDGPVGWAVRLWPLVPLLFALAAVSQWTMSTRSALVAARRFLPLVAALYGGGVALAIRLAPEAGLFRFRFGSWLTLVGSIVVAGATLWPVSRRGSDAPEAS